MDYGFHAPTLSFPVAGTIMIEPTESENQAELDRFCDALLNIREEIDQVARGEMQALQSCFEQCPTYRCRGLCRQLAILLFERKSSLSIAYLKTGFKFWASVGRVDNAHGDRNLVCTCNPIEDYMKDN